MLLFWPKSIPWAGNELAGDDVENCENSPLTLTNFSHFLQFCIGQRWNTLEIMSDSDVYLSSASSTESCDTSYSSFNEEIDVATTVQPYEGESRASKDFDKDWQRRFLACDIQVKIEQKNLIIECLVFCFCVLFLIAKSMERMASFVRSCCPKFYFFVRSAAKVPLDQCYRVSFPWSNSLS